MSSNYDGLTVVEIQPDIDVQPDGSTVVRRRFQSVTRAEMLTKSAESGIAGFPLSITQLGDGPGSYMEVEYGGSATETDAPIAQIWRATTGISNPPLTENPRYASTVNALTIEQKESLRDLLAGSLAWSDYASPDSLIDEMVGKYMRGTTNYLRPDPMFYYQAKYQRTADFFPDCAVVGRIYLKATMLSATGAPSDISAKLPTGGHWLCEDVDFDAGSDGSRILTMQFRWGIWDTDLYTLVS